MKEDECIKKKQTNKTKKQLPTNQKTTEEDKQIEEEIQNCRGKRKCVWNGKCQKTRLFHHGENNIHSLVKH